MEPHYAWAWNGRGLALEAMDRREEALISYERACAGRPVRASWYWINQIEPLLALGRREDALDVIDEALKIDARQRSRPGRARGRFCAAWIATRKRWTPTSAALEISPEYGWAWNGKGLAYAALGRWEEALDCYDGRRDVTPNDVWFWHNRGEALMQLERWKRRSQRSTRRWKSIRRTSPRATSAPRRGRSSGT